MRNEFREIVSGWALISCLADLTERIEQVARWGMTHTLEPDEEATVKLMIAAQIARGVFSDDDDSCCGDFDDGASL